MVNIVDSDARDLDAAFVVKSRFYPAADEAHQFPVAASDGDVLAFGSARVTPAIPASVTEQADDAQAVHNPADAVTTSTMPVFTYDQIADQLVTGYWVAQSQAARRFDVGNSNTITIDISGLTATGQYLAVEAFNLWSDITGIGFAQRVGGAQITLDDEYNNAFEYDFGSFGITDEAHINIGLNWLAANGTTLNSYSFQTYLHEIGHALGLGHAGNYNSNVNYATDALYQNDSWATTVMSYFNQSQNTYFSAQGFTYHRVITPMLADIVAITRIYGTSTDTRVGDTTYGFNNISGRDVHDALLNPNAAYTIFDNGGIDTLDYSGYSQNQRISLIEETFSNIGSGVGNVSIARGVVIENAIGGSGNDQIIGNAANNYLDGRGGADTMLGGAGNDIYIVDNVNDVADETGGRGTDEVRSTVNYTIAFGIDILRLQGSATVGTGTSLGNSLFGGANGATLSGLGGDDFLYGRGNADLLDGGIGNDTQFGGNGNDTLNGGDSNDTLRGEIGSDSLNGDAGNDLLFGFDGIDTLRGGTGDDTLRGELQNDFLYGDAGADVLFGGDGNDALYGGGDRDTLNGGAGNDSFYWDDGDFSGLTNATADRVQDFMQGQDRLRLNLVDAIAGGVDNGFTFIGVGAFTAVAGQLRYTQGSGVTLVLGDTDGDGVADVAIALTGTFTLIGTDFVL